MDYNELISIIVPFYNCENYIEICINSILKQTYKNLEIIFINDGSSDRSADIVKKYKEIKIIENETNRGVSYSRNIGIENANGKYIIFVDSDDYIENTCIEELYKIITKEKADIVSGNIYRNKKKSCENTIVINGKKQIKNLIDSMLKNVKYNDITPNLMGYSAGKLYKYEVIEKLKFYENIKFREDTLFNIEAYMNTKKIIFFQKEIYFYRENTNSASFRFFEKYEDEILTYYNILQKKEISKESIYIWGTYMYMEYLKHYALNSKLGKKEQNQAIRNSFKNSMWLEIFKKIDDRLLKQQYKVLKHLYLNKKTLGIKFLYYTNEIRKRLIKWKKKIY